VGEGAIIESHAAVRGRGLRHDFLISACWLHFRTMQMGGRGDFRTMQMRGRGVQSETVQMCHCRHKKPDLTEHLQHCTYATHHIPSCVFTVYVKKQYGTVLEGIRNINGLLTYACP
jgi:hypothetical protein